MSVAPELMPDWKQWEGELADGQFPLNQLLGTGEKSAVFLTGDASGEVAIKLVPVRAGAAADLLEQWSAAARLKHPHLLPILKTGVWDRHGNLLAYMITERAEENLAAVLDERALSPEEVGEMLPPIADALAFVHGQGWALRSLKASNVVAVGDSLKIATDAAGAGPAGDDLRALAAMIATALTKRPIAFPRDRAVVESLPEPFREITQNCVEPAWSAAELAARLRSPGVEAKKPAARRKPAITKYVFALAALLIAVITIGTVWRNRTPAPVPAAVSNPEPKPAIASAPAEPAPKPPVRVEAAPVRNEPKQAPVVVNDAGTREVLPEIPAKARRTIRGKATVVVEVAVNEAGEVTSATPERGSRYLGKLATEAARKWHFAAGASRSYLLRFVITQSDTKATVETSAR